ncbi:hypothetical protein [Allohahella marinimesophila]|uniref:B3/4 domain-containing protein n=1 Tax=Allohahella marinimesophila TaxID=1054972 RepID=A0ABP7PM61_9GAMM
MSEDLNQPREFKPLGQYRLPTLQTKDALHLFIARIRRRFDSSNDKPYIAEDKLHHTALQILNDVADPPAWGQLLAELDVTLRDWVAEERPSQGLKLIVLPPGEENGLLAKWARQNDHTVLAPPERISLLESDSLAIQTVREQVQAHAKQPGVLVIPELDRWFLRHRNGLGVLRALLESLDGIERHCVIGCNSWAWVYLKKAVSADMILPDGMTFQAFDAERLRHWFHQLGEAHEDHDLTFRLTRTGEDVMAFPEKNVAHDFFQGLAARSFGIPWVAWHLWRRSLRTGSRSDTLNGENEQAHDPEEKHLLAAADDDRTLWVAALEEYTLPGREHDMVLQILHALLIHGGASAEELSAVLPRQVESALLVALRKAGIIYRSGSTYRCQPAAYPAIRSGLAVAGFPTDRL